MQEAVITRREAQILHEAFVTIWQETEGNMRMHLMLQLQKRINQLFRERVSDDAVRSLP